MARSGVSGPPCPECESIRTRCLETGYSDSGTLVRGRSSSETIFRLRRRKCLDCDAPSFSTIEIPVKYPFTKLDRETAFKKLMWYRAKYGAKPRQAYHKPAKLNLNVTVRSASGRKKK